MDRNLEGADIPATITAPAISKLTPKEFSELLQRERAKGNPLALFVGSSIDPDDPEDKAYWAAIHEHRRQMEEQLLETEAREDPQPRMIQNQDV